MPIVFLVNFYLVHEYFPMNKEQKKNIGQSNLSLVWVIIPSYNEDKAIRQTIKELKLFFPNILVVDDHSSDSTQKILKDTGVHILRHSVNLGQGAALKTGCNFAIEELGAMEVITFDADGQHSPKDARGMLDLRRKKNLDVVLGSRFLRKKENIVPWKRKILLKTAIIFTKYLSNIKVTDTHNGLRVFSSNAYRKLNLTENRMAHASEILDEISKKFMKFEEYPTKIKYTQYSISKGQNNFDSLVIFIDILLSKVLKKK